MQPRPKDFFGFEDYSGGDYLDDVNRIINDQEEWDRKFKALPLWRRIVFYIFGE